MYCMMLASAPFLHNVYKHYNRCTLYTAHRKNNVTSGSNVYDLDYNRHTCTRGVIVYCQIGYIQIMQGIIYPVSHRCL